MAKILDNLLAAGVQGHEGAYLEHCRKFAIEKFSDAPVTAQKEFT
jgi:hypothetical protein